MSENKDIQNSASEDDGTDSSVASDGSGNDPVDANMGDISATAAMLDDINAGLPGGGGDGWGDNDNGWGNSNNEDDNGWGVSTPPSPKRIGAFPWKGFSPQGWVVDHVRENLEQTGWRLDGSPGRDTSLDELPSQHWAPIQLFRLTSQGPSNAPAPTFTGQQVATRLADIIATVSDKKRAVKQLEKKIGTLDRSAARLRNRKRALENQIREIQPTREDLEDLHLAGLSFGRG
ncbi:hypothetical protein V5O48_012483 [Marasmius crinis-equi]|uniref:Uncharacterized protein n=1 Tax=Marasmius crinis-equi TaxID=585013 RepID=A0ABR3F2P9_9AGAR